MPTYQYACTACDEQLEVVQSFSDASLTECPACSGRLRKKYGAVGVVFKGSGFYKTDSRAESKTGGSSGETKGSDAKGSESNGSGSKGSGSKGAESTSGSDSGTSAKKDTAASSTSSAGSSSSSTSSSSGSTSAA